MSAAMATARRRLPVLLLCCFVSSELVAPVHGQPDVLGFISIDCGIAEGSSYTDGSTRGLKYVSDAGAGANAGVRPPYSQQVQPARYLNVRYFPGARSCYTLRELSLGAKYLVRCGFYYGNYDKLRRLPAFDLYLGVDRWATVNVTAADERYILEAVVVSPASFFQVCLVNIGLGTPSISWLDLRPLGAAMYPEATVKQSLLLPNLCRPGAKYALNRYHFWRPASSYGVFRYPSDPYDRIWQSYGDVAAWTNITTAAAVNVSNASGFDEPSVVLQSAATPVNGTRLDFSWTSDSSLSPDNNGNGSTAYVLLMYFAELQRLPSAALRQFSILINGALWNSSRSYTPKYLSAEIVKMVLVQGSGDRAVVSLVATPEADAPAHLERARDILGAADDST